jgi:hypothetical protein
MKPLAAIVLSLAVWVHLVSAQSLENASVAPISLTGNDMVFDSTRNVLYLSIPSSAGFPYGNSIVTIDPATGGVIHTTFVGSEPDRLAISSDGSRVYVGLDGADSFCWWEPATDNVGPLVHFTAPFGFGPYNATDFAIDPNDSHTVVVSKDDVSSTAAGDLEVFHDNVSLQEMNLVYGAESICFSGATNLIGYNNQDTGFDLWSWAFDGAHLTQTQHVMAIISGVVKIKTVDGLVFADNGKVVSALDLSPLGTFSGLPGSSVVEPIPGTNFVYFLGSTSTFFANGYLQLACFDRKTYLNFDFKTFTNSSSAQVRSFFAAGKDPSGSARLGYIQLDGHAGIITISLPLFKIEGFHSNGSLSQLAWPSDIGRGYQVQRSSDLYNWTTFLTTNAIQFRTTVSFSSPAAAGREFYRILSY